MPAASGARYAVALGPVTGPSTIGESCVDRYLPPISRDTPGGNALNVAAGLAAAGLPTAYVGAVGDDEEGRFVLAQGRARGIDMRHVAVAPGRTGRTTITVTPEGDRVFDSEVLGVSATFRPSDEAVEFLKTPVMGARDGPGRDRRGAGGRRRGGRATLLRRLPPASHGAVPHLAPLLEVAFLSAPGSSAADAADLARDAVDRGARSAVVGRGKDGCLMLAGGTVYEQPAVPARVVDTLGAGDALIAHVVAALLAGPRRRPRSSRGLARQRPHASTSAHGRHR